MKTSFGNTIAAGATHGSTALPEVECHAKNKQRYVCNAYRVLLTRAREGMVIFVPKGNDTDPTRPSHLFDATADFLVACGVRLLD